MLPRYSSRELYLLSRQRFLYRVTPTDMTPEQLRNYLIGAAMAAVKRPQEGRWCNSRYSPKMVAYCEKWLLAAKSGENVPRRGDTVLLLPFHTPKCRKLPPEAALFENFKLFYAVAGSEWPQR